jgi:hypothetical protein
MKDVQATLEALKRQNQALQNNKFLHFFFCPSGQIQTYPGPQNSERYSKAVE